MKYKKYIFVLILTLFIGCNNAYAKVEQCYYTSDDAKFLGRIEAYSGPEDGVSNSGITAAEVATFVVEKQLNEIVSAKETVLNWIPGTNYKMYPSIKHFNTVYDSLATAEVSSTQGKCPKYVYMSKCSFVGHLVVATNDINEINEALQKNSDCTFSEYGSNIYNGNKLTYETYKGLVWGISSTTPPDNSEDITGNECEAIFGDKSNPDSLRYLIDQIMQYVSIIVPILIILLGTFDFAKAAIAGKEDEMKKAQSKLVKRLLIGLVVFLVPLLVDIIMWLADFVWNGFETCKY